MKTVTTKDIWETFAYFNIGNLLGHLLLGGVGITLLTLIASLAFAVILSLRSE
jgi:hypothetical protein